MDSSAASSWSEEPLTDDPELLSDEFFPPELSDDPEAPDWPEEFDPPESDDFPEPPELPELPDES